jgi:predicted DNA-binding protein
MKKPKYVKTLCFTMSFEMHEKIMQITNDKEISVSEFVRDSIDLKFKEMEELRNENRNGKIV